MKVINLTPHAINYYGADKWIEQFPPDGTVARLEMEKQGEWVGPGVKLRTRPTPQKTVGLPPQNGGTLFIVSSMVRDANPSRLDLLSPADLVRDAAGAVVGCRAFDTNWEKLDSQYGGYGI